MLRDRQLLCTAAIGCDIPKSSREVPSGTYLRTTFLLRYCTKPYNGDCSPYRSTAPLTSTRPPTPFPKRSTSARPAYLRRNLYCLTLATGKGLEERKTHHPPPSSRAEAYASLTSPASKPSSDMLLPHETSRSQADLCFLGGRRPARVAADLVTIKSRGRDCG